MPTRSLPPLSLAAALLILAGCSSWHPAKNQARPAGQDRRPDFTGVITLVNEDSRFVMIDGGYSPAPPEGLALKSFTGSTESAALTVSAQHRRPYVIADIVSGTPKKGDRVGESTPAPPADPTAPATKNAQLAPAAPSLPVQ